jgi:hypothetical protein
MLPEFAMGSTRQSLLGSVPVGSRRGKLAGDLGAAGGELTQPAVLEGAQLIGELGVHRGHVGDAGGDTGALALELVDEASEIVQPGAFRTPVDDAQDGIAGGKVRADVDAGRGFHLAFDRGTQGDEASIDDSLGARCLQQGADRQPPDRGHQQQTDERLGGATVLGPEPGCVLGGGGERRFVARGQLGRVRLELLPQTLQAAERLIDLGNVGRSLRRLRCLLGQHLRHRAW